jgi:hypothetical protein
MEWAARLLGATRTLYNQLRFLMSPIERTNHDRDLAALREALGEEVFSARCAEGHRMTIEQAITYAFRE